MLLYMLIGLIGVAGAPQARGVDGPRIRVVLYHEFTVVLHADGQVAPVAGQQARLAVVESDFAVTCSRAARLAGCPYGHTGDDSPNGTDVDLAE